MTHFSLYTEDHGEGFPILCLHGHPGSAKSMGIFREQLSDRFRIIAPDLRGYGKSQTPDRFEMNQHLEDLIHLLDDRGLDRVLVLGWSLGGMVAMELALRYPDRVSGLILIATAARPWGTHPTISRLDQIWTGMAGMINLLRPGWVWNIDQIASRSLFRYLIHQHRPAVYHFLAREAVYAVLKTSRQADQALDRAIQSGYNRVPELGRLSIPVLMLIGTFDRHIAPAASLETAKAIPKCEWTTFEAAHLIPWECRDALVNRIETWLLAHPEVYSGDSDLKPIEEIPR